MKAKAKVKNVEVKEENSAVEKQSEAAAAFPPTFSVSEIKNKQRRHFMFMKLKQEKRKVNREITWSNCPEWVNTAELFIFKLNCQPLHNSVNKSTNHTSAVNNVLFYLSLTI